MIIYHELPVCIDSTVYKTNTISSARHPCGGEARATIIIDVCTIDQTVGKSRRTDCFGVVVQFIDGAVVPVIEEEIAEVLIIISRSGTVDDDSTKDALPCLQREVRMVPGGTVLLSFPGVGDALSRSSWALSDGSHTVVLVGIVLTYTVEVDTCAIEGRGQRVLDMDHDRVTPVGDKSRARKGPVHSHGTAS